MYGNGVYSSVQCSTKCMAMVYTALGNRWSLLLTCRPGSGHWARPSTRVDTDSDSAFIQPTCDTFSLLLKFTCFLLLVFSASSSPSSGELCGLIGSRRGSHLQWWDLPKNLGKQWREGEEGGSDFNLMQELFLKAEKSRCSQLCHS